jgi:hypothetical protein
MKWRAVKEMTEAYGAKAFMYAHLNAANSRRADESAFWATVADLLKPE